MAYNMQVTLSTSNFSCDRQERLKEENHIDFSIFKEKNLQMPLESLRWSVSTFLKFFMFLIGYKSANELDIGLFSLKTNTHLEIDCYWKLLLYYLKVI